MAEQRDDNATEQRDSGRDRATVALVDAKVDGLRELIRAEFANVKEDVKALAAVVSDVIKLGVQADDHERRIKRLEDGNAGAEHERRIVSIEKNLSGDRDYRRQHLPTIIFAGIVTAIGLITLILTLTSHLR